MSIPDHLIEEIRQRADLVEIVSEYTRLKRSGRTFRGPCPLHGGSGPNFSVDPAKGIFKCFTCGEAGDLFSFPMKQLGMSFLEAVRFVAERVGVEIPEREERRPEEDPNAQYHAANAFAAEWFRRQLWEGAGGEAARAYLERRGVSREAAERFGLGWAPESWSALGDAARRHGISDVVLLALGLVKESRQGSRAPYDAFRGRLIFPIEEMGGRVIAFGGRLIGEAENAPKYLNSPETPVYHKGNELYGLAWSRGAIRKAETALLVEGYMDYVSLAAHGVENVVAALGTALTPEQAEKIVRYTKRVILLYDSDFAGMKATFRSGDELLRAGAEVLVATLPDDEDPDSLVRSRGKKALERYLGDAVDVLERKIQLLERRGYFENIADTRRAVDALIPTIRAASDEVLRGIYLSRISDRTGVPRETLEKEAAETPAGEPRAPATRVRRGERGDRREHGPGRRATDFAAPATVLGNIGPERNLVLLLLRDERFVERAVMREIGAADFRHPIYRAIFEGLLHADGERDAAGEWLSVFPPEALRVVEELRGDPEGEHLTALEEYFEDNVRMLQARPYEERLSELERELQAADAERQIALLQQMGEVRSAMRERGLPVRSGFLRSPARRG